jgi:predicted nucleic acid-binding protein
MSPFPLRDAASLMERYANVPMDFAEATLLLLAEGLVVHEILTLDRRGFGTYRMRRKRHMTLVLGAR